MTRHCTILCGRRRLSHRAGRMADITVVAFGHGMMGPFFGRVVAGDFGKKRSRGHKFWRTYPAPPHPAILGVRREICALDMVSTGNFAIGLAAEFGAANSARRPAAAIQRWIPANARGGR